MEPARYLFLRSRTRSASRPENMARTSYDTSSRSSPTYRRGQQASCMSTATLSRIQGAHRMRRLPLMLVVSMAIVVALASGVLAQQPAQQPPAQPAQLPKDTPASSPTEPSNFFGSLFKAYVDEFKDAPSNEPEPPRRALASPLDSPPFPSSQWHGFPLIGVPYGTKEYPLTKAVYGTPGLGDFLKNQRIKIDGCIKAPGNLSTAEDSNIPTSYWICPNEAVLNQAMVRFEREVDTVQQDH